MTSWKKTTKLFESKISLLEAKVDTLQQKLDDISSREQAEQNEQTVKTEQTVKIEQTEPYIIPAPKGIFTVKSLEKAIKTLLKHHVEGLTSVYLKTLLYKIRCSSYLAYYIFTISDSKNGCKTWDSLSEDEKMGMLKCVLKNLIDLGSRMHFLKNCVDFWPLEYFSKRTRINMSETE